MNNDDGDYSDGSSSSNNKDLENYNPNITHAEEQQEQWSRGQEEGIINHQQKQTYLAHRSTKSKHLLQLYQLHVVYTLWQIDENY